MSMYQQHVIVFLLCKLFIWPKSKFYGL